MKKQEHDLLKLSKKRPSKYRMKHKNNCVIDCAKTILTLGKTMIGNKTLGICFTIDTHVFCNRETNVWKINVKSFKLTEHFIAIVLDWQRWVKDVNNQKHYLVKLSKKRSSKYKTKQWNKCTIDCADCWLLAKQ